ncbi:MULTISPECIES: hypothetical protein [unclassified Halomonas]|uniref:hypothetical protein n=1 Tax=unclassified Halomonas TaxID=2609666 RepID=UPI00209F7903|nr:MULTISPECIES: hypothetical protein [unclassified Halomonas]MCP1312740.1 hypothetical protein [Halomonas sp. 707D7]MCP1328249.1 hypothetical protein [Halomonas sp. 707D4]
MQTVSAERVSVTLGLCVVMLSIVPRYLAGGHQTHLTMLLIALAVVIGAAVLQWRLLASTQRGALAALLKRLAVMMLAGAVVMGAWHALMTDWISWQRFISHAATCGLLLHAVTLGWRRSTQH